MRTENMLKCIICEKDFEVRNSTVKDNIKRKRTQYENQTCSKKCSAVYKRVYARVSRIYKNKFEDLK